MGIENNTREIEAQNQELQRANREQIEQANKEHEELGKVLDGVDTLDNEAELDEISGNEDISEQDDAASQLDNNDKIEDETSEQFETINNPVYNEVENNGFGINDVNQAVDAKEAYEAEIRDMSQDEYHDQKELDKRVEENGSEPNMTEPSVLDNDLHQGDVSNKETKPDIDISPRENTNISYNPERFSNISAEIYEKLKTERDTAYFWSGCHKMDELGNVVSNGDVVATDIAKSKNGVTLESTIRDREIELPAWDFDNLDSIKAWEEASSAYAEQVSGDVKAVIGENLRDGNIWENIELPRLMENPNVTSITTINSETMEENAIFNRDEEGNVGVVINDTLEKNGKWTEIMDALKDRADVNSVTVFNPEGTEIQYLKKGNNYNEDNRY
ncbi:MAG: hypothetical protein KH376_01830 [Holdemanella biformis]|uniref:hypothetical protein n=1 Tax=Holdemanella biformis TaxID=1735 RepID=UPI00242C3C44|nr:hypothetical protein [Holdemanella biformis]MBS6454476.1 hypothetical protein [Holdemanella biformis]